MPATQDLIATACRRFTSEVSPLEKLKLDSDSFSPAPRDDRPT
jgi:hypothetical protein